MNERYNAAVDRVRDEMAKAGPGAASVGEVVTDLLKQMPALQAAVLQDGKTLEGCYKELEKYARAHKKGSSYFMPPGEAMELICRYYGLEAGAVEAPRVTTGADAMHGVPTGDAENGADTGHGVSTATTDALDELLEGL